jgi:hypothetical protein
VKLDEIKEKIKEALWIDPLHLDRSAIETPVKYGQLLVIRSGENMELKKLGIKYADLENQKRLYYSGKADPAVYKEKPLDQRILKTEIQKYLNADVELQELALLISIQQEKVDLINDSLKGVLQKTFHIKAALDYQKMQNGVI